MACIGPDGSPADSGRKLLRALEPGPGSPEEVAEATRLPLFRVSSGLRELGEGGLVQQEGGAYAASSNPLVIAKERSGILWQGLP